MGRPRKHPELKRLDGNPGKRPFDDLLIVADGEPTAPEHLSEDGTACFEMIVRSMPPSVYATADTFMLAAFAEAWSMHKRATLALQAQPLVLRFANGQEYQNPWLTILNGQARIMATIGSRLGLNPAARIGLNVSEQRAPSKFEGLLGPNVRRRFDA
jgi:P27 family predicted phage terminase small subunit